MRGWAALNRREVQHVSALWCRMLRGVIQLMENVQTLPQSSFSFESEMGYMPARGKVYTRSQDSCPNTRHPSSAKIISCVIPCSTHRRIRSGKLFYKLRTKISIFGVSIEASRCRILREILWKENVRGEVSLVFVLQKSWRRIMQSDSRPKSAGMAVGKNKFCWSV